MNATTWEPPRGFWVLVAMNRLGKPMYQGTAPAHEVARRRARNKVARRQRRVNRLRAA